MKVKDCMCNDVFYVTPDSTVQDCAKMMSDNHVGCVPVCDNLENVVGIVTDRDIILRSIACDKDVKKTTVKDIMTHNICSCSSESDIKDAENLMSKYQIRRLPVIDNNKIVGIITLGDFAKNNCDCEIVGETLENICCKDEKNCY